MESPDNRAVDGERGFVHVLIEQRDVPARRDDLIGRGGQRNSGLALIERSYQVGFHDVQVGLIVSVDLQEVELVLDLGGTGIIPSFVITTLGSLYGADRHDETGGIMRGRRGHQDLKRLQSRRRDHYHVGSAGLFARDRDHPIVRARLRKGFVQTVSRGRPG